MSLAAQLVLPLPANDHRPLALRHRPLALVSFTLVLLKVTAIGLIALTPSTAELSTITVDRIVQLTNSERKKAGLPELKVSRLLTSAAQQKAADMLAHDYFAHISPSGVTPWFWMNKVGYAYYVAGENLAIDFTDAEDVVTAWMASPSHRENLLLKDYQETGIAVATGEFQGGTSTVVVHMFGRAATETTTVSAPTVKAPTPSPTASPSPTPSTTPAPRAPRIALLAKTATVYNTVDVEIAGDRGSTTHFLINGEARPDTVRIDDHGAARYTLNLSTIPDGLVAIRAYSFGPKQPSDLSDPLVLTKDTVGPALAKADVSFIIAPSTDTPRVIAYMAGHTSTLKDISLTPEFYRSDAPDAFVAPAYFSQISHRVAASIFVIVTVLLSLAVFIRIRIQHPILIAHASLVLLLALTVFFF